MEIHLILIFMICASLIAVQLEDLISSVIALSAAGLGLSLAFLILKAPNLAITQLVVEILCVIILIRGTIKKDLPIVRDGRWFFNTFSTIMFLVIFLVCAFFALKQLPVFGQPIMRVSGSYLARVSSNSGVDNIVSAITLNLRSYDALAEAAVLFVAVIGVLAITRRFGKTDEE